MPKQETNYLKMLFQSTANLSFIGVMVFLSLVFNSGFLFLLIAGQLGLVMLSQLGPIQAYLRKQAEAEQRRVQEALEEQIVIGLPEHYRNDFYRVKQLCEEIERRAAETETDKTSLVMVSGLTEKLSSFRFEYVRMLRAHFLLGNRNYKQLKARIDDEIKRFEDVINKEQSPQVRATLGQNLKILHQRSAKLNQLNDLVRLLEARLQVVRNSLQLIQDEVYSLTNVRGISEMVDGLITNMQLSDEFRTYYDDVLSDQSSALSGLDMSSDNMVLEPELDPKESARSRQKSKI